MLLLVLLPWWPILRRSVELVTSLCFTPEWVLGLMVSLGCWFHCPPSPGSSLVHLISPSTSIGEISLVRTDVHATVTRLVALTVRHSHVRNRTTAPIEARAAYPQVFSSETRRRRNSTGDSHTLVRELRWFRERDANRIVAMNRLGKEMVMTRKDGFCRCIWNVNFCFSIQRMNFIAQWRTNRACKACTTIRSSV